MSPKECEAQINDVSLKLEKCMLNINGSLHSVSRPWSDIYLPYCALGWLFHLLETTMPIFIKLGLFIAEVQNALWVCETKKKWKQLLEIAYEKKIVTVIFRIIF